MFLLINSTQCDAIQTNGKVNSPPLLTQSSNCPPASFIQQGCNWVPLRGGISDEKDFVIGCLLWCCSELIRNSVKLASVGNSTTKQQQEILMYYSQLL